jgi:AcrR family transcriptional regulator
MVTATPNPTVERILEGALKALARHGPRKLSMSDVCAQAGIARGTLYRYFKSKDELLLAVGNYVQERSQAALAEAIEARPALEDRLHVVLDVIAHYDWLHPGAIHLADIEPEFALTYVRDVFPRFVDMATEALEPAKEHIPALRDGALETRQLAELAQRIGASTYFVPSAEAPEMGAWLEALVSSRSA